MYSRQTGAEELRVMERGLTDIRRRLMGFGGRWCQSASSHQVEGTGRPKKAESKRSFARGIWRIFE